MKRNLGSADLLARFTHAAQAEFLDAVEDAREGPVLRIAEIRYRLPDL